MAVMALALVVAMFVPPPSPAEAAGSGATFTSYFPGGPGGSPDESEFCKQTEINCNHYIGKKHVVLNGGPTGAALADGTYFFAVLAPGGQPDPNGVYNADTNPKVLSTDGVGNRTFTVSGGAITYGGTHDDYPVKSGKGKNSFWETRIRFGLEEDDWFQDTPNNGGVYIAAICDITGGSYPARPRQCKYDAFKVDQPDENPVRVKSVLGGRKYLDANGNGLRGAPSVEPGIAGWTIRIYTAAGFAADPKVLYTTQPAVTDAGGVWTWNGPEYDEGTFGTDSWVVCEAPVTGWTQTGPSALGTAPVATEGYGGATVALNGFCYNVTTPKGAAASGVSNLDFGNQPDTTISGAKYFDTNADGDRDTGEAALSGWRILIEKSDGVGGWTTVSTETTDSSGAFSKVLTPGTYSISEVATTTAGWTQTGNTTDQSVKSPSTGGPTVVLADKVYTVTIPAVGLTSVTATLPTVSNLLFGNVCSVDYVFNNRTIGYWQNKTGNKIAESHAEGLRDLNLRWEDGTDYDPDDTDFDWSNSGNNWTNWLSMANASNMAYMLSAQMAGTWLNVEHGNLDGNVMVNGKTVTTWIAEANALLAGPDPIIATSEVDPTLKAQLEVYKNLFDAINNSQTSVLQPTLVSPTACGAPAYAS